MVGLQRTRSLEYCAIRVVASTVARLRIPIYSRLFSDSFSVSRMCLIQIVSSRTIPYPETTPKHLLIPQKQNPRTISLTNSNNTRARHTVPRPLSGAKQGATDAQ
ncbi:hypothetical protein ACGC1H_005692 [Rhizoctonia solani]